MMQPIDQAKRFLRLANRDLQAFYVLKEASHIDLTTVCFHAQQVVEKCLKAILIFYDIDPTRTHDLNKIAYTLIENNIKLPISIEKISTLTPFAVIFRYDDSDIEILSRNEAQLLIETIYNWANKILNS